MGNPFKGLDSLISGHREKSNSVEEEGHPRVARSGPWFGGRNLLGVQGFGNAFTDKDPWVQEQIARIEGVDTKEDLFRHIEEKYGALVGASEEDRRAARSGTLAGSSQKLVPLPSHITPEQWAKMVAKRRELGWEPVENCGEDFDQWSERLVEDYDEKDHPTDRRFYHWLSNPKED